MFKQNVDVVLSEQNGESGVLLQFIQICNDLMEVAQLEVIQWFSVQVVHHIDYDIVILLTLFHELGEVD